MSSSSFPTQTNNNSNTSHGENDVVLSCTPSSRDCSDRLTPRDDDDQREVKMDLIPRMALMLGLLVVSWLVFKLVLRVCYQNVATMSSDDDGDDKTVSMEHEDNNGLAMDDGEDVEMHSQAIGSSENPPVAPNEQENESHQAEFGRFPMIPDDSTSSDTKRMVKQDTNSLERPNNM